jgi:hypothetical protein
MRTNILPLALLGAISLGAGAETSAEVATFKCFLDTNAGLGVYSFTWPEADTQREMLALAGSPLVNSAMAAMGVRVYAKKVFECVPEHGSFASPKARKLDEERPR